MKTRPTDETPPQRAQLDYWLPPTRPGKQRFITPAGLFLLAGFCALIEFGGWVAEGDRPSSDRWNVRWADIVVFGAVAVVGLISLIEGCRLMWRRSY